MLRQIRLAGFEEILHLYRILRQIDSPDISLAANSAEFEGTFYCLLEYQEFVKNSPKKDASELICTNSRNTTYGDVALCW